MPQGRHESAPRGRVGGMYAGVMDCMDCRWSLVSLVSNRVRRDWRCEGVMIVAGCGARVAVLVVRDPDGGTDVRVWCGNDEVEPVVFEVDAGRGWSQEDWAAAREASVARAEGGLRLAVAAAFDAAPGAGQFVGVL